MWKRLFFRCMMAPLTRVVCVSRYVRDSFNAMGFLPYDRTTVVYNGVDLERVNAGMAKAEDFRSTLGISAETFLIVQVGQIIPEKGVPDLLQAAAQVCLVDQSIHFVFVGDGQLLTEYRNLAGSLGLNNKVTFTGQLADPLAAGVFAAADLVCQVSRWEEAFGLVIAEAMAAARPVLATRTGGIPELVSDGVTGYTVERGDVEAMTSRILELASSKGLCVSFGEAGQKICREKFDHRTNVTQVMNLYGIA
jgi:glycosyltransferase involved in cell wall biosynthesis